MIAVSAQKMGWQILKKSFLPLVIFLVLLGGYIFYKFRISASLPVQLQLDFKKYAGTVFIISITFLIQRIIGGVLGWYKDNITKMTASQLDDEFIPLLKRVANIIIWIIAILIILSNLGININALLATLGVGSLAIALAAQDTISNIIAGFLIMIDKPFRIGDEIKLPSGERVKVLDVGIRRSRFLNLEDNAIIIMPNLELSKSKITNFTYGKERKKT